MRFSTQERPRRSPKTIACLFTLGLAVLALSTDTYYEDNSAFGLMQTKNRLLAGSSGHQQDETRHRKQPKGQQEHKERKSRRAVEDLNYVAFGSSNTWGAGLPNRESEAFIFRLSPSARNLGVRAHGMLYPSRCASTMLGDDEQDAIPDVIVIEGFECAEGWATDRLALRLRQRYPDAIIVFLGHVYALMVRYAPKNGGPILRLDHWAQKYARGIDKSSPDFTERMKQMEEEEGGHFFMAPIFDTFSARLRELSDLVGGFPAYPYEGHDAFGYIRQFANYTTEDYHHPSAEGHAAYASIIKNIINNALDKYPDNPRVEEWDYRDGCKSWFETGETDVPFHGMTMREFSLTKHALEVDVSGGSVVITNPSKQPQNLFVEFMVTGPPSNKIYPKTNVTIKHEETTSSVVIDPSIDKPIHFATSHLIGEVHPGDSTVLFKPQEASKEPFRITAIWI